MKSKAILTGVAAIGLATAPVAAQSGFADRAAAPVAEASELEGDSGGIIIAILAAAAIIAGILIAAGGDDDEPLSL